MSASVGVARPHPWWAPWRSEEIDPQAVREALGPLLGTDLEPILQASVDVEDLTWLGAHTHAQVALYRGTSGIRQVAVSVYPSGDYSSVDIDAYRADLRSVIGPLQQLARTGSARLFIEGGDVTDWPLDEAIAMVAD
jgi:hypothetical protein